MSGYPPPQPQQGIYPPFPNPQQQQQQQQQQQNLRPPNTPPNQYQSNQPNPYHRQGSEHSYNESMPTPPQFNHQYSNSSSSSSQSNLANPQNNNYSQSNLQQNNNYPQSPNLQPNLQQNNNYLQSPNLQNNNYSQSSLHVGEAPAVQQRRNNKQVEVRLFNGHYTIEFPVSSKLTSKLPQKEREFTYVRYTACTCDPDKFQAENYTLRQELNGRSPTEIFIVITMYNEDAELFARTFYGVVKNIKKLCDRPRSKIWGPEGWKKVVVCVVSDGRAQINESTKNYLAAIGVYQEGIAREKIDQKDVTAHIYEYTSQACLDPDLNPVDDKFGNIPIQILFCLKEKNAKKINSHRWFFNAFSKILNPTVCILLDAGTRPGGNSIYHLWKAFDNNSSIGGACGEIIAMKGKKSGNVLEKRENLLNPLVAAQNFEYKMSNILDKPLESVFGYITVLPGAFSAYRYIALKNSIDEESGKEVGPLASYFLGEKHHKKPEKDENGEIEEIKTGLFEANMYLAEDRILCFELVSKRDSNWLLHYVKSAYAETDVPDSIVELISQRRRWLNGSFFAGLYAIINTFSIWRSSHSTGRKLALLFEMLYQTFNVAFSWFALGNLYLTFHILGNSLATDPIAVEGLWSLKVGSILFNILKYIYIGLIILQFSLALGNKPRSARKAYIFSTAFFSLLMIYMLFATGWITYKGIQASKIDDPNFDLKTLSSIVSNFTFRSIVISVLSTYGLYLFASLLFFEPGHMFHSIVQYMLLVPFYVNILNVYAFCNIHDVSWGTKGEPKAEKLPTFESKSNEEKDDATTVELPDVDEVYTNAREALKAFNNKSKDEKKELSEKELEELQKESNAMFRTYLVFSWMISNGILIGVITNYTPTLEAYDGSKKSSIYFGFVLFCVAGLAAVRFIGSCVYLIFRLFNENICDCLGNRIK